MAPLLLPSSSCSKLFWKHCFSLAYFIFAMKSSNKMTGTFGDWNQSASFSFAFSTQAGNRGINFKRVQGKGSGQWVGWIQYGEVGWIQYGEVEVNRWSFWTTSSPSKINKSLARVCSDARSFSKSRWFSVVRWKIKETFSMYPVPCHSGFSWKGVVVSPEDSPHHPRWIVYFQY